MGENQTIGRHSENVEREKYEGSNNDKKHEILVNDDQYDMCFNSTGGTRYTDIRFL